MPLLVTCVFRDEVKVFAADNQSTVHLGRNNGSSKDTATDGNQTGEGALLVNIGALDGGLGCPEAQSDVLIPSPTTLSDTLALAALSFGVEEDVRLLLESAFTLDCKFGRHDCGDRYLAEKEG